MHFIRGQMELPQLETITGMLTTCRKEENLANAKFVQTQLCGYGLEGFPAFGSYLVPTFVDCGSMSDAKVAFCKLSCRTERAWTSLIQGYVDSGEPSRALNLYPDMQQDCVEPTAYTLQALVKASAKLRHLDVGQEVHSRIIEEGFEADPYVGNTLVVMYSKCGSLAEAQEVFEKLLDRDVIAWNALLTGYADLGLAGEVLECTRLMHSAKILPNAITFACSFKAYGSIGAIGDGRRAHAELVLEGLEEDELVASSLVDMYAKCGSLEEAEVVFEEMLSRDTIAWTALISGYAELGFSEDALECLDRMQLEGVTADFITYLCCLIACMTTEAINKGRAIHADIVREEFEIDNSIGSSLVDMYAKCGFVDEARSLLEEMSHASVVTWNALISGYTELEMGQEALDCFQEMQSCNIFPDEVTLLFSLKACALVGAIDTCHELHAKAVEYGLETELHLGNSIMNVYSKAGMLGKAHTIFEALPLRDTVSWNTMIAGYRCQGEVEAAFDLFDKMINDGVPPDDATFLSVLTLCNHAGLMTRGRKYYNLMRDCYGALMSIMHHNCMMDLLGRAGQITEAWAILEQMPLEPDLVTWKVLLSACQKWGNVELGRDTFERAMRSNKKDVSLFIMMYSLYAEAHMWEDAKEIEQMRKGIEAEEEEIALCWEEEWWSPLSLCDRE